MISVPIWLFVLLCLPLGMVILCFIIYGITTLVEHILDKKFVKEIRKKKNDRTIK